jgi:hypothetical protein
MALALCGCAPNSLQGSLGQDMSLSFDSITIQRTADEVSVSYLKGIPGATGNDIVFEIIANTDGVSLSKGGSINLAQVLSDGTLRGSIARVVHDNPSNTFPPIVRGTLTFGQNPAVGARVSGSFTLLFGEGGEIGSGTTAFGTFVANVVAAPAN